MMIVPAAHRYDDRVGVAQWMIVAPRRLTDRVFDLDTLEVLERIAETGSISGAADTLGVTQQAISARLRAAERAIGQPLAHRSTSGSLMTDTGRLLLELAGPVLGASRRLEASMHALRQPTGSLAIAASQTIAELLLPRWLLEFRQHSPDVDVKLVAGSSGTVTQLVRTGGVHLGFIEAPVTTDELCSRVITQDELAIVVAPEHPWARVVSIGAEELSRTALLLREEGSGTRATLEAWLHDAGLALTNPAAVLETTAIVRANARAGLAPAVMSMRTVEAELAAGVLVHVPLREPAPVRPLRAIWSGHLGSAGAALLDIAHTMH